MTHKEAIEWLASIKKSISGGDEEFDKRRKESIDMAIKALEQEPKTGHWIEERTHMECPNCHDIWHYEENQTERFKFCPTCGRKEKSNEDRVNRC